MPERATIGLDNPAFYGRLRQSDPRHLFASDKARSRVPARPLVRQTRRINDVRDKPAAQPIETASPQPPTILPSAKPAQAPNVLQPRRQTFPEPAENRLRPSTVLKRPSVPIPRQNSSSRPNKKTRHHSKLQISLAGMAALIFLIGLAATIQTIRTNHQAAVQVAALAKKANNPANGSGVVPSTTKPSPSAVSNYVVAPNLPRYLKIPKLGVDARVLQAGVTASGALGTPPNVFDSAWYTGSAEPGQPGAMLIDGHVSSWSTAGVFYGLRTLQPGDTIQIVRGDGTVFNYQVVKTETYTATSVSMMQAAMTPVTPGTSGLNLISCTGDVIPGTSLFNARIVVFAQEVSSS
jgi:sortase (surface protein transpeptidase)